uniref:V-type proton ATPase subunit a n=1 Tax=Meloidogyne javanica TaxID=6303 RepID=A0A915MT79_MELJA
MNSIHRSEEMCLVQLFLQNEAAYLCVAELGEIGLVQFRDVRFLEREIKKDGIVMVDTGENTEVPLPRETFDLGATFDKLESELREVNQNEEMLRKNFAELTELKHILRKTQQFFDEVEYEHKSFGRLHGSIRPKRPQQVIETPLDELEPLLVSGGHLTEFRGRLKLGLNEGERQALHSLAQEEFLDDGSSLIPRDRGDASHVSKGNLKFVAGVIQRERLPAFERLLWRACRGNVFLRQAEITEPLSDTMTGLEVQKAVFIIFFQGDQLKSRVKKICEGFRATIYPCPDSPQERREMSIGVMTRIEDLKTVLGQTQDHRHRVLVAAARNVRTWLTKVRKVKAIYHTLNLFNLDVTQKCLIAECWCPVAELDRIQLALKRGSDESGSSVPSILNKMETLEQPPTFHRTNKFTRGFQNIVDSYGIASYREINPAPYTMITFPFLFALMFGDLGHGLIMFLFGLYLVLKEKRLEAARINDEIFQMFFSGRYVIFLMGLFSIYTGFIYNDVFSKSFNIFGTSWGATDEYLKHESDPERMLVLPPHIAYSSPPYPFGVDPIWNLAETNKLNFLNSMKMKGSVIIGISQMAFGIALSYYNFKHSESYLDINFTFIPQVIFLSCIFVYLCLEIVAKWLFFNNEGKYYFLGNYYPGARCAPSLLIGLINMFMMKSRKTGFTIDDDSREPGPNCHLNYWYPGQGVTEFCLLVFALLAIPVMLLVKPLILWRQHKDAINRRNLHGTQQTSASTIPPRQRGAQVLDEGFVDVDSLQNYNSVHANLSEDGAEVIHHGGNSTTTPTKKDLKEFDLGDTFVYQAIHTIEFALGCISHTASYLRLWALSLAHAQLSDVLWTMVFRMGLLQGGYLGAVLTYFVFLVFATMTVFILVLMEGLSAFLHALRLHWVEFQSKFYAGTGHLFMPFSFITVLEEARIAEETFN